MKLKKKNYQKMFRRVGDWEFVYFTSQYSLKFTNLIVLIKIYCANKNNKNYMSV